MEGEWPVRDDVASAIDGSLQATARPGEWWTGAQRLALAELARAARTGAPMPPAGDLPQAAADAAVFMAATPAQTTQDGVSSWVAALGEAAYVEVLGVVARTVAVDTFHRALGLPLPDWPEPQSGDPARTEVATRKTRAWVGMLGFAVPPNTLSAAPSEQAAANRLEAAFYMTGEQMENPDQRRGQLHRTQIEVVATTVSHTNDCFY